MDLSLTTTRGGKISIHFGKIVTTNLWNGKWFEIQDAAVIQALKELAYIARKSDATLTLKYAQDLLNEYPNPHLIGKSYTRNNSIVSTNSSNHSTETQGENTETGAPSVAQVPISFKRDVAKRIIQFFSEFTFTPAIRFVNTFANYRTYADARKYINNYMSLCDHPDKDEIAEKIKSDEFKSICDDLFKCECNNSVNKRLEIYYGPAGTGKTTKAIAKYPDAKVTVCNETMDSTDLMKTFSFNDENGKPVFKPSALQEDMIAGRPHILDEINLLPLSSLRYLQGILDGKKEIEFEGKTIQIADGFKIIGTMNLIINGQVFNLPEPIVDRASVLESYQINSEILASYAF